MLLKKLQKKIDDLGLTTVASRLGYRSHTTLLHWKKSKRIPKIAQQKVKEFLNESK